MIVTVPKVRKAIMCKGIWGDAGRVDRWVDAFSEGKAMSGKIRSGSLLKSTSGPIY